MVALDSTDPDPAYTQALLADAPRRLMDGSVNDFAIDCEEHANWLVRKIVNARQYAIRVKEWAEEEVRRAEREEQTLMYLFGLQLERWAKQQMEKLDGRRKSIALPAGKVGFRTVPARLVVDLEEVVVQWARQHCPQAVVTKIEEKLVRTKLKSHFEETGEMPEAGAHVEPEHEQFHIG